MIPIFIFLTLQINNLSTTRFTFKPLSYQLLVDLIQFKIIKKPITEIFNYILLVHQKYRNLLKVKIKKTLNTIFKIVLIYYPIILFVLYSIKATYPKAVNTVNHSNMGAEIKNKNTKLSIPIPIP
jgi:hypothetical protein